MHDPSRLDDDLEACRREFDAIEAEAHRLLDGLTDAQLTWQPTRASWSIGTCLDHLNIAGRQSLIHIEEAVVAARGQGLFGSGPFRYGTLERWIVWLMEPPVRVKFPAPRAYRPQRERPPDIVVKIFSCFGTSCGNS